MCVRPVKSFCQSVHLLLGPLTIACCFPSGSCNIMLQELCEISKGNMEPSARMHKVLLSRTLAEI